MGTIAAVRRFKKLITSIVNAAGLEVRRYPTLANAQYARRRLMEHLRISLVLDVGANIGQYAQLLYDSGYRGRCISFEPVAECFAQLRAAAARRGGGWSAEQLALGDASGSARIHLAGTMSSLLARSPAASDSITFADGPTQEITLATFDSIRERLVPDGQRVWLKMDVQGYELSVLRGARESLPRIAAIEAEMSLWPFYSSQPLYHELIDHLDSAGFDLWSIQPGHRDPQTTRLIEMDGIFVQRC
ncbi:MAG TPA: FkbM family methyltransferase [Gemmataceae bacterium]|nr:FkbM family methyltransferase [Gemmataceae bacterium]